MPIGPLALISNTERDVVVGGAGGPTDGGRIECASRDATHASIGGGTGGIEQNETCGGTPGRFDDECAISAFIFSLAC